MRHCLLVLLAAVMWTGIAVSAQNPPRRAADGGQHLGTWVGMWDGSGAGSFEITIEKSANGPLGGKVAVGTEAGDYSSPFTSLSFDGKKMRGTYDFPFADQSEIVLSAEFEAESASGTWSLRQKGQDSEQAGGPFTVKKKSR